MGWFTKVKEGFNKKQNLGKLSKTNLQNQNAKKDKAKGLIKFSSKKFESNSKEEMLLQNSSNQSDLIGSRRRSQRYFNKISKKESSKVATNTEMKDSKSKKIPDKKKNLKSKRKLSAELQEDDKPNKKLCSSTTTDTITEDLNLPNYSEDLELSANNCSKSLLSVDPIIDAIATSDSSLLIALHPGSKIYFSGNTWIKQVVGKSSVMGYILQENESHSIFSNSSQSAINICGVVGKCKSLIDESILKDLKQYNSWIQKLPTNKNTMLTIIELRQYKSKSSQMLKNFKFSDNVPLPVTNDLWHKLLGVHLVDKNTSAVIEEPKMWGEFVTKLEETKDPCVVVSGGIKTGKSTFFRYLVNNLLNSHKEVACIDIDPGQPEFSLPSCISISVVNNPLLGPQALHLEQLKTKWQKIVSLGVTSVEPIRNSYNKVVESFTNELKSLQSMPVVVNTMGYTVNVGFNIMVDLLRILKPSHVVTLNSYNKSFNFKVSLKPENIASLTKDQYVNPTPLNYDLTIISSMSKLTDKYRPINQLNRDACIMSFLSCLWNDVNVLKEETVIPLSSVSVHNMRLSMELTENLSNCDVLKSLGASIVALCRIDEQSSGTSLTPLQWRGSLFDLYDQTEFLQWGVITRVNIEEEMLHIVSPLSSEQINDVNFILKPKEPQLPKEIGKMIPKEVCDVEATFLTPEHNWQEWLEVYGLIGNKSVDNWQKAFDKISSWKQIYRDSSIIAEIEATYLLLKGFHSARDQQRETIKFDLNCNTICKFVSCMERYAYARKKANADDRRQIRSSSMEAEIPYEIRRVRNAIAHYTLDTTYTNETLERLLDDAMNYITCYYWKKTLASRQIATESTDSSFGETERKQLCKFLQTPHLLGQKVSTAKWKKIIAPLSKIFFEYFNLNAEDATKLLVEKFFTSKAMTQVLNEKGCNCCDVAFPASFLKPLMGIVIDVQKLKVLDKWFFHMMKVKAPSKVSLCWMTMVLASFFPSEAKICSDHKFFIRTSFVAAEVKLKLRGPMRQLFMRGHKQHTNLALKIAKCIGLSPNKITELKTVSDIYLRMFNREKKSEQQTLQNPLKILTLVDVLEEAKKLSPEMYSYVSAQLEKNSPSDIDAILEMTASERAGFNESFQMDVS